MVSTGIDISKIDDEPTTRRPVCITRHTSTHKHNGSTTNWLQEPPQQRLLSHDDDINTNGLETYCLRYPTLYTVRTEYEPENPNVPKVGDISAIYSQLKSKKMSKNIKRGLRPLHELQVLLLVKAAVCSLLSSSFIMHAIIQEKHHCTRTVLNNGTLKIESVCWHWKHQTRPRRL